MISIIETERQLKRRRQQKTAKLAKARQAAEDAITNDATNKSTFAMAEIAGFETSAKILKAIQTGDIPNVKFEVVK